MKVSTFGKHKDSDVCIEKTLNKNKKLIVFIKIKKQKINFEIIGSAHNYIEISRKVKQGCSNILFSKLFLVDYNKTAPFLGIIRFNCYLNNFNKLIPLGGIKSNNLNFLRNINSDGFAIKSEIKKKPTITSRLF